MNLSILNKYYNLDITKNNDIYIIYCDHKSNNNFENCIIQYKYSYTYNKLILISLKGKPIIIIHRSNINRELYHIMNNMTILSHYYFINYSKNRIEYPNFDELYNNDLFITYHKTKPYFFKPLNTKKYLYSPLSLFFPGYNYAIDKIREDIEILLKNYKYTIDISPSTLMPSLSIYIYFSKKQFDNIIHIYEKGDINLVLKYLKLNRYYLYFR